MKWVLLALVNAVISAGISVAVHYFPPGYAPSPKEFIWASNGNNRAITKLSKSVAEVIKRLNEIAPPKKGKK